MNIKKLSEEYKNYIIEKRRFYHSCPEVSTKEIETKKHLIKDLEELGIDVFPCKNCNGVVGLIKGSKPGKTVALRSDTDGLEVVEKTDLSFASKNGNMHACGHDAHMSMLLGAGKILSSIKDELCGNVKLIFQPAEEIVQGAKDMIAEGVMEDVDAVYGVHVWGTFDAPLADFSSGNRMAGAYCFKITVEGVATHGSSPHLGVDAIVTSASIIQNLQTYVSRENDPLNPFVLTIGTINGGSRFNIIANKVVMEGAIRTFSTNVDDILKTLERIVTNTASSFNAKASVEITNYTLPVINNNEDLNNIARNAVKKLYGEESLGSLKTIMGSEDFSFFMEKAPGIYGFLGIRNEEKGIIYTNHHEKFTVDEDVLHRGSAIAAQFAVDFLNN